MKTILTNLSSSFHALIMLLDMYNVVRFVHTDSPSRELI